MQFGKPAKPSMTKPSRHLIFNAHGGAWAAQTSKSHEVYLREWAALTEIPILTIDYSLAPKAPFPRAIEEIFYAYCWALKNSEHVGWSGEKVIFVGDSAGGNLLTCLTILCIEKGIRRPDGILLIYTPHLVGFPVAPARFMSLIDPVLPFGFTSRLIKSYCEDFDGIDQNNNAAKVNKNKTENVGYKSYEEEFNVKLKRSYLMSGFFAPDDILRKFPPTKMLSTNFDPCLDDGIEFAKKLRNLNVETHVDVIPGLIHGFLYFVQVLFHWILPPCGLICISRLLAFERVP